MKQRRLGKHGPLISPIGLGCMGMSLGYGAGDDTQSIKVIQRAIDLGITFLDTADMYGWGHNETLINKAIKSRRDEVFISTKVGFTRRGQADLLNLQLDGSPSYIKDACNNSLQRLGTETIDLYYLHRVDPATPIEDSMIAMADLVKSGKVRYVGLSEVKPETIRRAAAICPISAVQTEYSLWERSPELEIIPTCRELGIAFIAYSPLGRGFLTGTIKSMSQLSSEDCRPILPRFQKENFFENQKIIPALEEIASEKQCSLSQLALAWILAQSENIIPIPGTKQIKFLEENWGALNVNLTKEDCTKLGRLVPINSAKGNKYPTELELEA